MLLTPNIAATLNANAIAAARATPVCVVAVTAAAAGTAATEAILGDTPRSRGLGRPSHVSAAFASERAFMERAARSESCGRGEAVRALRSRAVRSRRS